MSPSLESNEARMKVLKIRESDLEESFAHSSGPGGQNVNKVATAVRLRHVPTGVSVTVQDSRSQLRNRQIARERLLAALERREREHRQRRIAVREQERRRRSPRPRALKKRILEGKKRRANIKRLRGKIIAD
jgi:protein subunit release factor B